MPMVEQQTEIINYRSATMGEDGCSSTGYTDDMGRSSPLSIPNNRTRNIAGFVDVFDDLTEQIHYGSNSSSTSTPTSKRLQSIMESVGVSPDSPDSCKEFLLKCHTEKKTPEKAIGESEMLKDMNVDKAFEFFQMANSYYCYELQENALNLIMDNFEALFESPEFQTLNKHDLRIILEDNRIYQKGVSATEILDRWYRHEQDARYSDYVKLKEAFVESGTEDDFGVSCMRRQWSDPTLQKSVRSPMVGLLMKRRAKTHIAILSEGDREVNFSVIQPDDPSQTISRIESPPFEEMPENIEICVADFCRTEHMFFRADSQHIFHYDIYKAQWKPVPSLKTKVEYSGFVGNAHAVYNVGGRDSKTGNMETTVFKYNVKNKKWKEHGKLERPVFKPVSITYRGDIYIFGGDGSAEANSDFLQTYAPGMKRSKVHQNLSVSVSGGKCVISNDLIYIATQDKTLIEYDPRVKRNLKVCKIDLEGDHFEIVSDRTLVYIIDGDTRRDRSKVLAYYPKTSEWHFCGIIPNIHKIHCAASFQYNPNLRKDD